MSHPKLLVEPVHTGHNNILLMLQVKMTDKTVASMHDEYAML